MGSREDEEKEASKPLQEDSKKVSVIFFEKRKESSSSSIKDVKNGNHFTSEKFTEETEKSEEQASTQKSGWRRYAGIVFALFCSLFFSITVLLAKILNQSYGHHPFVITMWRYGGILLPSIPVAIYFQKLTEVEVFETIQPISRRVSWENLFKYLMQGILGCTATIFRFISLKYIPIADSTVVFSAYTVLVAILAHIFIGEKCGVVSVMLAFLTAIGVIIMARPPIITGEPSSEFDLVFLKGIGFAILALMCTGTFLILMRKIRKTHFALMMLVGGTWGVFEGGLLAILLGVFTLPQGYADWGLIIALACFTFLGQACFVLAVKYESAGPLSIARGTESIFAYIWQYLFLSVIPDLISITGGVLIIAAVVGTGYCKYLASLPVDNPTRRRLEFLLR